MAFRQCPKRLWLKAFRRDLATIDPTAQARFDAGHRVGDIAPSFAGGMLIGHVDDIGRALQETRDLLAGADDACCSRRHCSTAACSFAPTCSSVATVDASWWR